MNANTTALRQKVDNRNYVDYSELGISGTLTACLDSGGRLPKGQRPPERSAKPVAAGTDYAWERFGNGWADVDGDCQNSRQEALIAQSTAPVRFAKSDQCQYIARFLRVVTTYKLTLSEQEARDYQGIRSQWCS
ncbi:hypothetical protein [Marinobacterium aestuariivivens]|uniref:DUF1524 domain-containing protein n=1 Tax=Marinobacterium aestuariivivens TaxID=1698799 RepID=A0ABW2A9C7_9GAMM